MYYITINNQQISLSELDYDLIPDELKKLLENNDFVTLIK
jgi:hypothetical protein